VQNSKLFHFDWSCNTVEPVRFTTFIFLSQHLATPYHIV
jgi:hypothetical protein